MVNTNVHTIRRHVCWTCRRGSCNYTQFKKGMKSINFKLEECQFSYSTKNFRQFNLIVKPPVFSILLLFYLPVLSLIQMHKQIHRSSHHIPHNIRHLLHMYHILLLLRSDCKPELFLFLPHIIRMQLQIRYNSRSKHNKTVRQVLSILYQN